MEGISGQFYIDFEAEHIEHSKAFCEALEEWLQQVASEEYMVRVCHIFSGPR